jgi:hypothetical protein
MFTQLNATVDSVSAAVKNALVTKSFTPNAYQANPSIIIDALENSFKEMFDVAPGTEYVRTITARQPYAGGENVFVYTAKRVTVHASEAARVLYDEISATAFSAGVIIWALPDTLIQALELAAMSAVIRANQAYYTTKHLSVDVGRFASDVSRNLQSTKFGMRKFHKRITGADQTGAPITFLHTKQVVLSSGDVLTAELHSDGTVMLFVAHTEGNTTSVDWHEERFALKLTKGELNNNPKSYKWSEDEFNAAFVKLVAKHAAKYTEELAQAALGAKPLTKSSVVKEFADTTKAAKNAAKEAAKVAKEEPAEATPEVAEPSAEVAPVFTAVEQELVDKMKHDCPNFVARIEITEGGVRIVKFDHIDGLVSPVPVGDFEGDKVSDPIPNVQLSRDPDLVREAISSDVVSDETESTGETVVNMGELTGVPARQVKPCKDTNAIRIIGKVISKKALHVSAASHRYHSADPMNMFVYTEDTKTLHVRSAKFSYRIVCDVQGTAKSTFALYSDDLQALGEAIDYDFNRFTSEYFITSNVLMVRLVGNGSDIDPVVFGLTDEA